MFRILRNWFVAAFLFLWFSASVVALALGLRMVLSALYGARHVL